MLSGCNGEICKHKEDTETPDLTNCLSQLEYSCNRLINCQYTGEKKCSWSKTPLFKTCLTTIETTKTVGYFIASIFIR